MKLTWHMVKKDCRRLWLPLALWLGGLLGQSILLAWASGRVAVSPAGFEGLGNIASVWSAIFSTVGFILAAWLVMEDSLVSAQAFWSTRPICSGRLLVAKVMGAVLMFSLLPVLVLAPVWLWSGFSARELGLAALDLMVGQGILSLLAFVFACLTETSGQFLIRMMVAAAVGPFYLAYALGGFASRGGVSDGLAESRFRLVLTGFALTLVTVVVHQFLTRRKLRSYGMLAVGLVGLLGVRLAWPWDFSNGIYSSSLQARGPAGVADTPVKFTLSKSSITPDQPRIGRSQIRLEGVASAAPAGTYVRLETARGQWVNADERRSSPRFSAGIGAGLPPENAVRQVLGLRAADAEGAGWVLEGSDRAELIEQSRNQGMTLQLEIPVALMRGRVLGKLPLREGASLRAGASRTRLIGLERSDGKVIVRLEERDAWPKLSVGDYANGSQSGAGQNRLPEDYFVLLDPTTGTEQLLGSGLVGTVAIHSMMFGQRQFVLTPPMRMVNGRSEEIPGWEDSATLVKVRFEPDPILKCPLIGDVHGVLPH